MTDDPEIAMCLTCQLLDCAGGQPDCAWGNSRFAELERDRLWWMQYRQRPEVKTKRSAANRAYYAAQPRDSRAAYQREYNRRRMADPSYREAKNAYMREWRRAYRLSRSDKVLLPDQKGNQDA